MTTNIKQESIDTAMLYLFGAMTSVTSSVFCGMTGAIAVPTVVAGCIGYTHYKIGIGKKESEAPVPAERMERDIS